MLAIIHLFFVTSCVYINYCTIIKNYNFSRNETIYEKKLYENFFVVAFFAKHQVYRLIKENKCPHTHHTFSCTVYFMFAVCKSEDEL